MGFVVSSIVETSMNMASIALWIGVGVDDWTAELATIASNAIHFFTSDNVIYMNYPNQY